MSEKKERVVIVDDLPLFRERLAELINQELDMEICGEAEDAQQAIELIRNTSPDLVIVDITLKGSSGLEERAHEAEAASQPQTDDSQNLAAKQIDKSMSDLKEALAGLRDSLKKGDRKSFSLYKQQAIDALNKLSKRASLEINTEAANLANQIKSGKL